MIPDALPEPDYSFFPLETGRYIIYDVQESLYSSNATPTLRTFQVKETTGPAYTNVAGQTAYKLIRTRRTNETQPWQSDSIWSARLIGNEGIRVENGKDIVKLLLPIAHGQQWNENRYNLSGLSNVELRNVGQTFNVLNKEFSETVSVVGRDDSTLVAQEKRLDVYARQIGLIYKERTDLHFCTDTPACIGKNQIEYGFRQIYRIKTIGKE
ncbi:hypothetical protein [Spirosoma aerophilum]